MQYGLYLGCTIPARQPSYELASRKALERLGVDLIDLDKTTCCAPPPIESVDVKTSLAVAAYNLSLGEEQALNILTLCNGCFQSLVKTNSLLKGDAHLRENINETLSKLGRTFRGNIEVTRGTFPGRQTNSPRTRSSTIWHSPPPRTAVGGPCHAAACHNIFPWFSHTICRNLWHDHIFFLKSRIPQARIISI